jgi:NAD(P)-dependent dehydrogenase (short-subunit alcohol dehydrogenase family)
MYARWVPAAVQTSSGCRIDASARRGDAPPMQQLDGKVAVITGGASGIGLAMARRFAQEKMKLVLLDIEEPALAEAERALRADGATVLAIRTDVSSAASLEEAAARAQAAFGTLHVICNNAGVGGVPGATWSLSEADWDWVLSINLRGVINGVRIFLPPLLASGEEGHIVNTSSMAGLTSTPFMSAYTVAKHGVVALSEVLAKELELTSARVGVSVLCPGFVRTQIHMSARNRPADQSAAEPAAGGPAMADAILKLVESGQPPEAIAERVLAAIREPRFYVLTHPEMKPAIGHRMRDILEERPPGIDPMSRQLHQVR